LPGFYAKKDCPHQLRKVVVWDSDNQEKSPFNQSSEFGLNDIAAIYIKIVADRIIL